MAGTGTTSGANPSASAEAGARALAALALTALAAWALGAAAVSGALPAPLLPFATALACVAAPGILLAKRWSATVRAAALAAALGLLCSTATSWTITDPDTQPASQEPWTLLRHGTLYLDDAPVLREHPAAHWIFPRPDGRRASWYPPGMGLLALPIYLPTALSAAPTTALLLQFEKTAAALMNGLAILLLGLSLARAGSTPRTIFLTGLLYALASSSLSLLSQALWQETGCALAMGLILFAAQGPGRASSRAGAFLAGLICAATRPPDVLLLLPFLASALFAPGERRSARARFLSAALAGLCCGGAVFLLYNRAVFGSPWIIGYQVGQGHLGFTRNEFPESTFGLLFGPAHGLITYLPWLLVLPAALAWRERNVRAALASAAILLGVMSCWWCWWGASAFGPRMMSEVELPLAFALGRGAPALGAAGRRVLVALALVACATHAVFLYGLSRDPGFITSGPWRIAAHPLGYLLGMAG